MRKTGDVFKVEYVVRRLSGELGLPKEETGPTIQRTAVNIAASSQEAAVAYLKREEGSLGFSVTVSHVSNRETGVLLPA